MLQTDDLYLGALGLARGGELVRAFVRETNGRRGRVAVFEIAGPGMDDVEREYFAGRSLVDPRLIKSEVVPKNVAFTALRQEERDVRESREDRRDQASERPGRGRH